MAFADPSEVSQQEIGKFMKLLHAESRKPKSEIFPDRSWETLDELDASLSKLGEDYEEIQDAILDWLEKHKYKAIQVALQTVRTDPLKPNETPPPRPESDQPITNDSLRSAIKDAQNQNKRPS
ncbi:hypothetical protein PMG71_22205 [Roseofilum sp. BLCC_M154]|uniref:Uncharacterized protein n=1 Tax=Roseofilum acuticapitatum BLCC-M154 TaxID=3022444 RepID=A0ABT7B0U1_9CYAN|nr:hypothetical protein [Roseofilum acuticapitatum]MDJ1172146.1 hypothetical protein [Roseofilum acuticapitatum BLCC-M154]